MLLQKQTNDNKKKKREHPYDLRNEEIYVRIYVHGFKLISIHVTQCPLWLLLESMPRYVFPVQSVVYIQLLKETWTFVRTPCTTRKKLTRISGANLNETLMTVLVA